MIILAWRSRGLDWIAETRLLPEIYSKGRLRRTGIIHKLVRTLVLGSAAMLAVGMFAATCHKSTQQEAG